MKYNVKLIPSAELDVLDVFSWYESEQFGLGKRFLIEIENVIIYFRTNPLLYRKIYKNIRRSLLHKFPYGIYFIVEETSVQIISVTHLSRHPKNWKKEF